MTTTKVQMHDAMIVDTKSVRRTQDGYMTAFARVARTGIQTYRGYEVGRPDLKDVRVYRPESEVFNHDTLHSFAHRPVTMDHPPAGVSAKNWKEVSIGHTGSEVAKDGEFIRVPLVVMDAAAIKRVEAGHKQLSMGYSTELQWGGGITKDGQSYDAVQTAIRGNHLAVVTEARGGPSLDLLGDGNRERDTTMNLKTLIVDGIPIEVADGIGYALLTKTIDESSKKNKELKSELKDTKEALAKLTTDSKTAVDAKDGELAVLRKQLEDAKAAASPEKLDLLCKDRIGVIDKAKTLLGDKYVTDGKPDAEIMKAAVAAKLGDEAVKTMNDAAIGGAFAALTADAKGQPAYDGTRVLNRALGDGVNNSRALNDAASARDKAYEDEGKRMRDAWRTPVPTARQQ